MIRVAVFVAASAILVAGCGGPERTTLTVGTASSLDGALRDFSAAFEREHPAIRVRLVSGGSDEIAARLRVGGRLDAVALASEGIGNALLSERRLVAPLVPVAGNRLVVISGPAARIAAVADLARPGMRVVLGTTSVPVGSYADTALRRLGLAVAVERNLVSREPNAAGVVGKIATGAADAGIVYETDAADRSEVRVLQVPPRAQPRIVYVAAVARTSRHRSDASTFVKDLRGPRGRAVLRAHGFRDP